MTTVLCGLTTCEHNIKSDPDNKSGICISRCINLVNTVSDGLCCAVYDKKKDAHNE